MNTLERAKEIFGLQALSRKLLIEIAESLNAALADPGDTALLNEVIRKLAEIELVQVELKTKLSEWN